MIFSSVLAAAGGVGLFLLGIYLMTDGLKLAAGPAIGRGLAHATGGPARGVAWGALVTGLVQSSSAVTVATLGFVNAGLLSLRQSLWVIYGSNVGATLTGWLVALLGFRLELEGFALPLIGVGMLAGAAGGARRIGALGRTVAGFGLFFLGIQIVSSSLLGSTEGGELARLEAVGTGDLLLAVGAGILLTVLMQSSSAALVVVLAAVGSGTVGVAAGACAVIGANIGTTSTAALAVLDATPNAKRVALGHAAFNALTGVVALFTLPLVIGLLTALGSRLAPGTGAAALVAGFHTGFNVLGVALMLPLTTRTLDLLERLFRTADEEEGRPRHLDRSVVQTPTLSIHALTLELHRIGERVQRMGRAALIADDAAIQELGLQRGSVNALIAAVGSYLGQIQRASLPPELDGVLPDALHASRNLSEAAELVERLASTRGALPALASGALAGAAQDFERAAISHLTAALPGPRAATRPGGNSEALRETYEALKRRLLRAGADGGLEVGTVGVWLDRLSDLQRLAEQATHAASRLATLEAATRPRTRELG